MSRFTFILNPNAGKGSGGKLKENIYRAIKSRTSDFEFVETTRQGDATELAKHSSSEIVVAVGGDGTVHEVANGIIGTEKTLGVIPIGSGNDFIKSIGLPKDLEQSVSCLFLGKTSLIDVGRVDVRRNESPNWGNSSPSFFVNGLGVGFDAAVAERARHISYVSGTLVYLLAVFQTLGRYRSPDFSVSIDGRKTNSKYLLIAVGNGVCAGGGFYLTPEAKADDGELDVCLIEELSIPRILAVMPAVMKGSHRTSSHVKFEKGRSILIVASSGVCVHADGEILGTDITMLQIDVLSKALAVIVG